MSSAAERAVARLLLPAVRWDPEHGFHASRTEIERNLQAGVGGFIIFGGELSAVRDLTDAMQRSAPHPLLIASDLERGAGQQFRGATPLPPAAAVGSLDDLEVTRRAAEVTARETRAAGVGWVLAPVADVDLEPRNPIVATRAFSSDPKRVARQVEAWVRGCADGGALSCVKHFPGGGRAVVDSHAERPRIDATREELEQDLLPFRAAIAAGVDGVMVGHVVYPALDGSEKPATRSSAILGHLLRGSMRFDGIVATDAINMAGFAGDAAEGEAAVEAVAAGCDALLYPSEVDATIPVMADALRAGRLDEARVRSSGDRIARAAARTRPAAEGTPPGSLRPPPLVTRSSTPVIPSDTLPAIPSEARNLHFALVPAPAIHLRGRPDDLEWANQIAARAIRTLRGTPRLAGGTLHLIDIDDDLGGPHRPPSRDTLPAILRDGGIDLSHAGHPVLAIYADVRAWKGRSGLSPAAIERARAVLAESPEAIVILFGHPRQAERLPFARHVVCAWGGEPLMQEAAARRLLNGLDPT